MFTSSHIDEGKYFKCYLNKYVASFGNHQKQFLTLHDFCGKKKIMLAENHVMQVLALIIENRLPILKITGKISEVICLLFLIIVDFLLVTCQNNNMLCIYIYVPNRLFSEITSFRWHEENNRLLFFVTGIDNQGHYIRKFPYHDKIMLCKGLL